MKQLLLFVVLVFAPNLASAQIMEATCRVNADGSLGSGTVYTQTEDCYHVLTAAHVVVYDSNEEARTSYRSRLRNRISASKAFEKALKAYPVKLKARKNLGVEFFGDGFQSEKIPARLIWKKFVPDTTEDLAILSINKKDLGKCPQPSVIPVAKPEQKLYNDLIIASCGCPLGEWPTYWRGHILTVYADSFDFVPAPEQGRSGSGLFVNRHLVGVVIWYRKGEKSMGTAVSLESIYKLTKWGVQDGPGTIDDSGTDSRTSEERNFRRHHRAQHQRATTSRSNP